MRTKKGGIPSGTTIIINQEVRNYVPERPTTNMFAYYADMPPTQPHYKLVSTSGQGHVVE